MRKDLTRRDGGRRRGPGARVGCEALEGRQLLTYGLGFLQQIGGAVPLIQASQGTPAGPTSTSGNAYQAATSALRTELHALALKSGVTVGDRTALADALQADLKDISATVRTAAGTTALTTALATLKADLASLAKGAAGASIATVENDELNVLSAAGGSAADLAATRTALDAYLGDSGLTASDISTVYADQQAILNARPGRSHFEGESGLGFLNLFGRGNPASPASTPAPTLDQVGSLLGIPIDVFASLGYRQGRTATSPGPGTTAGTPTAYQQAVTKLQADLHGLALQSKVTVSQETTLADDVRADLGAITTRPGYGALAADLNKLASDLQTEIVAGTFNLATIQADEATILAAYGIPQGTDNTTQPSINKTLADQATIVAASGITAAQLQTIYNDEQAIIAATPPRRFHGFRR